MLAVFVLMMILRDLDGREVDEEIEDCLQVVMGKYFVDHTLLIAQDKRHPKPLIRHRELLPPTSNNNLRTSIIRKLLKMGNWTVQISDKTARDLPENFKIEKLRTTLLILKQRTVLSSAILRNELKTLQENPFWWAHGRILVLVKNLGPRQKKINEDLSRRIISGFWKLVKAVKVNVAIADHTGVIDFYTWFPYVPPDCNKVSTITHLDTWQGGRLANNVNLYPHKIPGTLNGCELIVTTEECYPYVMTDKDSPEDGNSTDSPPVYDEDGLQLQTKRFTRGMEVELMKTLSQKLNFQIKAVESPNGLWTTRSENGSLDGAFGLLTRQKIDMAYSCLMLNYERINLAEALPSYFDDSLIWFVPTPNYKSHDLDIFKAFPWEFWVGIFVTLVAASVTMIVITRIEHICRDYHLYSSISYVLKLIGMSLSSPVVIRTPSFVVRTFIIAFCFYSMHLTTAFQASLFTLYRNSVYEKEYDLRQAVKAGLFVYLRESTKNLYNTSDHDIWNEILKPGRHSYNIDYIEEIFEQIANKKSAMVLFMKSTGMYIINQDYTNSAGLARVLHIKERLTSYPVTIFMSPGHPLYFILQYKINRILAAGLVELWFTRVSGEKEVRHRFKVVANTPLSFKHLTGAFYIFSLLLCLSIVTFILEIVVHRALHKQHGKPSKDDKAPHHDGKRRMKRGLRRSKFLETNSVKQLIRPQLMYGGNYYFWGHDNKIWKTDLNKLD